MEKFLKNHNSRFVVVAIALVLLIMLAFYAGDLNGAYRAEQRYLEQMRTTSNEIEVFSTRLLIRQDGKTVTTLNIGEEYEASFYFDEFFPKDTPLNDIAFDIDYMSTNSETMSLAVKVTSFDPDGNGRSLSGGTSFKVNNPDQLDFTMQEADEGKIQIGIASITTVSLKEHFGRNDVKVVFPRGEVLSDAGKISFTFQLVEIEPKDELKDEPKPENYPQPKPSLPDYSPNPNTTGTNPADTTSGEESNSSDGGEVPTNQEF